MTMTLKIGELCAGYGGLGMAVEEVFGAELAWVSEFDDAPSKILAHHWPNVPNYGDMTKIDWAAIEPVDIISGGTPCQDLSHAGRRAGMTEGTRSNLWVQMREAIAIIQPTYVVWENVRGAYSAEANSDLEPCPGCMGDAPDRGAVLRALGRVLGDLSDLGYDCQWRGLRAADVGAPHGRFRVFILATHRDHPRRSQQRRPLAVPQEYAPTEHAGADAADTESERRDDGHPVNVRPLRGEGDLPLHASDVAAGPSGAPKALAFTQGFGGREGRPEYARLEGRPDVELCSDTDWGEYEPAIRQWESALGRRAPAPTELAASYVAMRQRRLAGRDKRPVGMRGTLVPQYRLSARFAEWMMGVPDGWIVDVPGISRNEALKAAGNGVVPQQAAAALRDMHAHTNERSI